MGARPILLVEDDASDEELIRRALRTQPLSIDVVVVHDGVEALEYLLGAGSERRQLPHLTLVDLGLPTMGGLELVRRLRETERTCRLPIVVVTSSTQDDDVRASYQLGANGHLRKGANVDAFSDAIARLAHYWLVLNQPPPDPDSGAR